MSIAFVGLLTTFVCACVCLFAINDLRRNYLKLGLFSGLGILHGVVPAITPYHLFDPIFSYDARLFAAIYALGAVIAIALGWALHDHFKPHSTVGLAKLLSAFDTRRGKSLCERLFWYSAVVGSLGIFLRLQATGSSIIGLAHAMRFTYRFESNTALTLLGTYMMNFSLVPGFLSFFLARRYRLWAFVYSVVVAALCFFAISKGTRSIPLGLCGSMLFGYFMQKEVDIKRLIGFACGSALIFWLAIALYQVRHEMSNLRFAEVAQLMFSPKIAEEMLTRDPLNYNENLVGAVDTFPQVHPFLAGATYRRMLFMFVPRSLCPELKPEDTNKIFAMEVFNTSVDLETTIPPTIPGDCYINFGGWGGLIALFGYGVFFAWVSRKMRSSLLWFLAISPQFVKFLLLGMRGQPYDLLTVVLFVMLGTWLMAYVMGMPFKKMHRELIAGHSRRIRAGGAARIDIREGKLPQKVRAQHQPLLVRRGSQ